MAWAQGRRKFVAGDAMALGRVFTEAQPDASLKKMFKVWPPCGLCQASTSMSPGQGE